MSKPDQGTHTGKWVSSRVQLANQAGRTTKADNAPQQKPKEIPKEIPEVASNTGFELQEASDTLSNFSCVDDGSKYELCGGRKILPAAEPFNAQFIEKVQRIIPPAA